MAVPEPTLRDRFNVLADDVTTAAGSLPALVGSVALVVIWALTGPVFNFSDTWQLFINTTTTVLTFWMVFVIQNSANRQSKATQLKLDEIIRSLSDARNEFVDLDHATEDVLEAHEEEFKRLITTDKKGSRKTVVMVADEPRSRRSRRK
jgi:low affinity Fe/Cu permease